MKTIIWYGVGKNLCDHENEFLKETGMPMCLCDADETKQGKCYVFSNGQKRNILSLREVEEKYSEYELWVTLADHNCLCVYEYLIKYKQKEFIRFFGGREWRLGCFNMQNYIYISSDNVKTCAHYPYTKHFLFEPGAVLQEQDVIAKLNALEKWRIKTINKLRCGEKTSCHGCSALHWGLFPPKPSVEILGVGPNFKGNTKCNCNCFYCNQNKILRTKSKQILSNYDIHRISSDYYNTMDTIILADGEPSIHPDIDNICELALEKSWAIQLNTNAILYREIIAEAIASNKDKSFMAVALDAGSRETYYKIKRVDHFDKVVENLHKYKEKGCNIFLKYILIPGYNDNLQEITKFFQLVNSLDVKHVTLSQNLSGFIDGVKHKDDPDMPEEMFCLVTYMVARLQEMGIVWDFQIEFISKHDIDRIEKLRK